MYGQQGSEVDSALSLYEKPQANAYYSTEVVTLFLRAREKILMLKRADLQTAPLQWCIPGGKVEEGELLVDALMRELMEELSWTPLKEKIEYLKELYVHHPIYKYRLHLFQCVLDEIPEIQLNQREHIEYTWIEESEIDTLDLIDGQYEAYCLTYDKE